MSTKSLAVVTGGAAGLGKAFACALAKVGYDLLLVDLPGSNLREVAEELASANNIYAEALLSDLTHEDTVKKIVNACCSYPGSVGMLINNAGLGINQEFETLDNETIHRLLMLNVMQTTMLMHDLIPMMKKNGHAHIINISSMAGCFPLPNKTVYAASKAYIRNLSLSLHCELKAQGIHVAVCCPSGILTNAIHFDRYQKSSLLAKKSFLLPEEVVSVVLRKAFSGAAVIIPGRFNKLVYCFFSMLPVSWQLWIACRQFGKPYPDKPVPQPAYKQVHTLQPAESTHTTIRQLHPVHKPFQNVTT